MIENRFYEEYGRIYDACLPTLRTWNDRHSIGLRQIKIAREPEMPDGEVAFLWLFAEIELRDPTGATLSGRVVVAPSKFLDAKPIENVFRMVFTTFGYGPDNEAVFIPFLFTDDTPHALVQHLKDSKGLQCGKDYFIVTPEGVLFTR